MRFNLVVACLLASTAAMFAQSDRGTITGTISDSDRRSCRRRSGGSQEYRNRRHIPCGRFSHRQLHDPRAALRHL